MIHHGVTESTETHGSRRLRIVTLVMVGVLAVAGLVGGFRVIDARAARAEARTEFVTWEEDVSDLLERGALILPNRAARGWVGIGSTSMYGLLGDPEMEAAIARALPIEEGWNPPAIAEYDQRTHSLVIAHNRLAYDQIKGALEDLRLRSFH
jgi:hypothetical protein